jgi:hypothetical protein
MAKCKNQSLLTKDNDFLRKKSDNKFTLIAQHHFPSLIPYTHKKPF